MQGAGVKPPVLCAGQGCEQRKVCLRYRIRVTGATWASFDVELKHFKGACPSYIEAPFIRKHKSP